MYKQSTILDLMVKDGVISLDIAKKINSGVSLFLLDSPFPKSENTDDVNMNSLLGANFSSKTEKTTPKTNFNGQISATKQSHKQGDCWLLSDINALNQTNWGKKVIKDSIVPDKNGSGGVIIKFKGSPIPQKDFHITAEEMQKAKNSGQYSSGDDDMMAFELATEKLTKELVKKGKGERLTDLDEIIGYKSFLTNIKIDSKHNKYLDISTLLTGREDVEVDFLLGVKDSKNILKYIAQNPDKTSTVCTFNHFKDLAGARNNNDLVHGNHAYAIKKINYGKDVTVIDPYNADQEINLSWDKFINDIERVTVASRDDKSKSELEQILPKNYNEIRQKNIDEGLKRRIEDEKNQENLLKSINQDKIDAEVNKISTVLEYLDQELKSNSKSIFTPNIYFHYESIKESMDKVNKDNVTTFLKKQPNIIAKLDKYKSGIGNGKDKKALIEPIINALIAKAQEKNINSKTINDFKDKCSKELNATFYTDADIIIKEVNEMKNLIEKE